MAKEKFNWKSIFVNEDSDNTQQKTVSFPNEKSNPKKNSKLSTGKTNTSPNSDSTTVNKTILTTVVDMYESGFESLNIPGYDFYEFFKAIKAVNSDDPSTYKMAITMAQSVDPKVDKISLLNSADFYINEIEKVHKQYATKGNKKREQIKSNQLQEKEKLSNEIATLEKQILQLQTTISNKKINLETSGTSLLSEIAEIEQKITANDLAKSKITETITTVINGIKNNL